MQLMQKHNSLYNTPPTLAIYLLSLVLDWAKEQGGIEKIAEVNHQKSKVIYDAIDESNGFYKGHARPDSRSHMNVTFNLPTEEARKTILSRSKSCRLCWAKWSPFYRWMPCINL